MRIKTTLTNVTNSVDTRGAEVIRLIKLYIPEFTEVYYGHRPIGAEDIKFPCAMVEPISTSQRLTSTGKYDIQVVYNIYFYFLNSNRDGLVNIATDALECLTKLFSNNALNDLQTAPNNAPRLYKENTGYWYDSEIIQAEVSPSFRWAKDEQQLYCRAGLFVLQVNDRQIK